MIKQLTAARWFSGVIAAAVFTAAGSSAVAQRGAVATAGSLAVADDTPGIERASCVLILRGSLRIPSTGMGGASSSVADLTALTTAITTTGLIDPAARAALGLGPREWQKVVRVEIVPAGTQAVKLSVCVDPGPNELKQPDPAGSLLRELVGRAKAVVGQSIEPRRQEIKAKLEELEKRRVELRSSLDTLRRRGRESELMASRGMTGDPLLYQRRQFETDLAAKRFRLQAINEILPRFTSQADEFGAALKGLVAAREALVAGLEKALEQGKVDPLEVLRARADLAEARVRTSETARIPSIQPGRNVRDERLGLEVDIATLEAQVKAISEKKDEPANHPVEDAQALRTDLFRAEAENTTLEQQYQQARREYEQLGSPPSLVVLDGQPN